MPSKPKPSRATAVAPTVEIKLHRLDEIVAWDRNPKEHDLGLIVASILRYGFRDAPIYDARLGAIAAGNGRLAALAIMRAEEGSKPPRGIAIDPRDGMWLVPVQTGIDARSKAEAEAFGIDHNNLTVQGGANGVEATLRLWNQQGLAEILAEAAQAGELPLTLDGDDLDALLKDLSAPPFPAGLDRASSKAESPHHDADGRAEKSSGKSPGYLAGGIPLAIVLDQQETRRWREAKSSLGHATDKGALMALLDRQQGA